jgi:hypothetical protein
MTTDRLPEILGRARISEVWAALGGGRLRGGRAPAFWRKTRDANVTLDDQKGVYFDHARGEGGGTLDLVQKARGCDRQGALKWLAGLAGVRLDDRPMAEPERRAYAQARREARPLAAAALHWWQARLSELEDLKREAFHAEGVDIDKLAVAARELYRMQGLSPDAVLERYIRAGATDPHGTRELVRLGETWECACKAVILACLTRGPGEVPSAA